MPSNKIAINEQLKLFPRQLCGLFNRRGRGEAPLGYFKDDFGLKWQLSRHSSLHPINDMGLRVKEHQKEKGMDKAMSSSNCGFILILLSSTFQGKGRRLRGKALNIGRSRKASHLGSNFPTNPLFSSQNLSWNQPPASRPDSKISEKKLYSAGLYLYYSCNIIIRLTPSKISVSQDRYIGVYNRSLFNLHLQWNSTIQKRGGWFYHPGYAILVRGLELRAKEDMKRWMHSYWSVF